MSITYSYITKKFKVPSWILLPLIRYLPCLSTFDHLSSLLVVFILLYNGNTIIVNYKEWLLHQWGLLALTGVSRIWANKLNHCSDSRRYFSFHQAFEYGKNIHKRCILYHYIKKWANFLLYRLQANLFVKFSIIREYLKIYTAIRLMRIEWKFSEDKSLGMAVIEDQDSTWYNIKPISQIIQNQLGQLLELNIIELDRNILKDVQTLMKKRIQRVWIVMMLAMFFLLYVWELDRRRNIFWSRYNNPVCSLFKIYNQIF